MWPVGVLSMIYVVEVSFRDWSSTKNDLTEKRFKMRKNVREIFRENNAQAHAVWFSTYFNELGRFHESLHKNRESNFPYFTHIFSWNRNFSFSLKNFEPSK